MRAKIWFITGVSSGFGLALAEAVMARGDFVIGSVRKADQVAQFNQRFKGKAHGVQMDVTQAVQVQAATRQAIALHGRIDVLVNNAGYGLFGAVEEASPEEIWAQMETNFFGAVAVTQAILPAMRRAKSGHIVQISSVAGMCATPGLGIYNASKFALEGVSEALAQEVKPLGIHVTIVEPGPFRTLWAGSGSKDVASSIADYATSAHATIKMIHGYDGNQPGDPVRGAEAIISAVYAEKPPLRLPLGKIALSRIRDKLAATNTLLDEWEDVIIGADFPEKAA